MEIKITMQTATATAMPLTKEMLTTVKNEGASQEIFDQLAEEYGTPDTRLNMGMKRGFVTVDGVDYDLDRIICYEPTEALEDKFF